MSKEDLLIELENKIEMRYDLSNRLNERGDPTGITQERLKTVVKAIERLKQKILESDLSQFNEYQIIAHKTAIYPRMDNTNGLSYTALGLANEAGEVAGVLKKFIRDGSSLEELQEKSKKELGDVLWYVAEHASNLNLTLEDIAKYNLEKLADRKERGTLKGSGDDR